MNIDESMVTVYTAAFGRRFWPRDQHVPSRSRLVVIGDQTSLPAAACGLDARRRARYVKLHPWEFVNSPYSVWIDTTAILHLPPVEIAKRYLDETISLAVMRHDERSCLYDEGAVVMQRGLDDRDTVLRQLARYESDGFPHDYGLAQTGFLVREHEACHGFCENWWEEIAQGSCRDQLSFDYCRWKSGLAVRWIETADVHFHRWKERAAAPVVEFTPH